MDRIPWREADTDLRLYHWKGDEHPFGISYYGGGDLARFKTWAEVNEWIKKHVVMPVINT